MKYFYFSLIAFFMLNSLQAQVISGDKYRDILDQVNFANRFDDLGADEKILKEAKGSPYATKDFVIGAIYIDDELKIEDVKVRYNTFSNYIEVFDDTKEASNQYSSLAKFENYSVKIMETHYYYKSNIPNNKNRTGAYLGLLSETENDKLFVYEYTDYIEKKKATTSYEQDKPAEFVNRKIYYIINNDNSFKVLSTNKKKVSETLKIDKKTISKYISKFKLDLKKNEDMAQLFTYLKGK